MSLSLEFATYEFSEAVSEHLVCAVLTAGELATAVTGELTATCGTACCKLISHVHRDTVNCMRKLLGTGITYIMAGIFLSGKSLITSSSPIPPKYFVVKFFCPALFLNSVY